MNCAGVGCNKTVNQEVDAHGILIAGHILSSCHRRVCSNCAKKNKAVVHDNAAHTLGVPCNIELER